MRIDINTTVLHIITIREIIGSIITKFSNAATITIHNTIILKYQSLIYHDTNSLSSSEYNGSDLIFLFTNGAKNIIPAIAESFACDEMIFFVSSIIIRYIKHYAEFFFMSVVINSFSVGDATILVAIC